MVLNMGKGFKFLKMVINIKAIIRMVSLKVKALINGKMVPYIVVNLKMGLDMDMGVGFMEIKVIKGNILMIKEMARGAINGKLIIIMMENL
jgi:hypothetical protein